MVIDLNFKQNLDIRILIKVQSHIFLPCYVLKTEIRKVTTRFYVSVDSVSTICHDHCRYFVLFLLNNLFGVKSF